MEVEPCSVCGGKDVNLVDGFYYCVECGTQDVNARETVVEHTVLADGTFAHVASRKFTTVQKDGIEMSGEWHKWHTYNFILSGLAEELVALGAKPSVKTKVLWVWMRYMKEFQNKDDMRFGSQLQDEEDMNKTNTSKLETEKQDSGNDEHSNTANKKDISSKKSKSDRFRKDINIVTKGLLLAMLYIGLNLDESDIQLSHLSRYVKEGRISIANCIKFVPKELDLKSIAHWGSFLRCTREYNTNYIRALAMACFKRLDLGTPLVPDLKKIISNFVTELCLPNEFKNLVYSLMNLVPCSFVEIDKRTKTYKSLVRMPDFEQVAMSYVLVALKMCFGLDCDYEIRLSEVVDKINLQENHLRCYKLGILEDTDRLFSFKEWCNYLQFRKTMLCKYYLPMAQQHNIEADDHVFMEHLGERNIRKIELSDEITMDILNKIEMNEDVGVIPKSEFPPTLTPINTYTEIILQYIQDPEAKLLLSEDFTRYSLKYACENMKLSIDNDNIVIGIDESNKTVNPVVIGTLVSKKSDFSMVFIRNCENKNWLKTNPPTIEHITKADDTENGSDHGYDSSREHSVENEISSITENNVGGDDVDAVNKKPEVIEEEDEQNGIYDDLFEDLDDVKTEVLPDDIDTEHDSFVQHDYSVHPDSNRENKEYNRPLVQFDPETFDKDATIRELILAACKKYKIPKPTEYNPKAPRKRKSILIELEAGPSEPKQRKTSNRKKPGETKKILNTILSAYYSKLENNVLNEVSNHVASFLHNSGTLNDTESQLDCNDSKVDYEIFEMHNDDLNTDSLETDPLQIGDTDRNDETSIVEEVVDHEDSNVNCLMPEADPKYDESTHDIKQLYIKFNENVSFEDILNFDDPEIDKILAKQIEEPKQKNPINVSDNNLNSDSDSDADIPLIVFQREKKILKDKENQKKEKLPPLIENTENITEFKYWLRHYTTKAIKKNLDMQQKFDLELNQNCPKSFNFVINECAAILDCTAYSLYKCTQSLEKILFS